MRKSLKKYFTFFVITTLAALIGYWRFLSPISFGNNEFSLFKIEQGQTLSEIADKLENAKLIRSDFAFKALGRLRGVEKKIKPGRYSLNSGMSLNKILNEITNPEQGQISVTIPEGFSVREIDKRLVEMGLILPGEFAFTARPYEGYLFPDTYFVFKLNFAPESLSNKMRENFLKKITPDLLREIEKQKKTLPQMIAMASILEKEVKTGYDLPVVSGILWKRLANNWPLQVDATLLYGKQTPIITKKELSDDNPYNTYKNRGLPPTPIGNPGMAAIRAAIFAKNSPYWFYLTDKEGNVHYAHSNEEHNENKRKYL